MRKENLINELNQNKFEIVYLLGQDNLNFKKKMSLLFIKAVMVTKVLRLQI